MSRRNITRFWRGTRRHPKWDMGTPPNPRGKHRSRRPRRRANDPRFYLKAVISVAALGLLVLPLGADAVNLALGPKQADGCRVLSVVDGDTVRLWCPGRGTEKTRLVGFDTPEVFSPRCPSEFVRGTAATWGLRRILFAADELTVVRRGRDRYGRTLAFMAVDGVPVAQAMIDAGHARTYAGGRRRGWCA